MNFDLIYIGGLTRDRGLTKMLKIRIPAENQISGIESPLCGDVSLHRDGKALYPGS